MTTSANDAVNDLRLQSIAASLGLMRADAHISAMIAGERGDRPVALSVMVAASVDVDSDNRDWQPTAELRFAQREQGTVLRQRWFNNKRWEHEWRDVPVIRVTP